MCTKLTPALLKMAFYPPDYCSSQDTPFSRYYDKK
jgi:hypothetical protein